jgi:XTP/dITP diphosphohydrolase
VNEIVLATNNRDKVREFREMLRRSGLGLEARCLADFPGCAAVPEDGETFAENAAKKALAAAHATGRLALGDDSGIEVDALAGHPGIRSARFAGEGATDEDNNEKLLALLRDVPERRRQARFVCCIAIADPEKVLDVAEGSCAGSIVMKRRGSGGFGYDPLFQPLEYHKTFAELPSGVKNRISHRARALEKALMMLEKHLYKTERDRAGSGG